MSSRITFIVPQIKHASIEGMQSWVEQLTELKLLAEVNVVMVPWVEEHAGSITDWIATVGVLSQHWKESDGFVIWAPEHSLLGLAGSLRLMFPNPGKPIVLFAAQKPTLVEKSKQKLLGLKASLINAVFLAQSAIAEVIVVSDREIYRPQHCAWGEEVKKLQVISSQKPLAQIDFKLQVFSEHLQRTDQEMQATMQTGFSEQIRVTQWFPGLKPSSDLHKEEVNIIMTNADFWGHPDILALQESLREKDIPVIWYSPHAWAKTTQFAENEVAISHDQSWWVALAAQFAFGNASTPAKAFKLVQANCS